MQKIRQSLDLKRAAYMRFFHSESWEVERRWSACEALDETLSRELGKASLGDRNRYAGRLKNLEASINSIDTLLPQLRKYAKECQRKIDKSQCAYLKHQESMNINSEAVNYLQHELECLRKVRKDMLRRLDLFKGSEEYLAAVVKISEGQFSSTKDVIKGFSVLAEERKQSFGSIDEMNSLIQDRQRKLDALAQTEGITQLEMMNYLRAAEVKKAELETRVQFLQQRLSSEQQMIVDTFVTTGKLELAMQNLYTNVCQRLNPKLYTEGISAFGRVTFITIALREIGRLREDVHRVLTPRSHVAIISNSPSQESQNKLEKRRKCARKLSQTL